MNLGECIAAHPLELRRDGVFDTPGLLSDPQPNMLVFLEDRRYLSLLQRTLQVSCVITTVELAQSIEAGRGLAVAGNPRRAFYLLHNRLAASGFYWEDFASEIHPTAHVHPSACVAEKNVRIGPGSIVEPRVVIMERCLIGSDVTIRAGTVLGSIGFQTEHFEDATVDLSHAGGILIHDGVHILANAVIASAIFRQFTTIGRETRVGNGAFVSHNVQIGPRCFIGHGVVVNGNVQIGREAWVGPGAVLTNNITIGERACISLGSTVIGSVASNQRVTGNVAVEHRRFLRHLASFHE